MPQKNTITSNSGEGKIKQVDRVRDTDIFVAEFYEDGKKQRLGHAKLCHQMNNSLGRISKTLRVSKSVLIRKILESYIKFFDESKAIGGKTHFDAEKTMVEWIAERYDMSECQKEIKQMNKMIQENSKSPEVQLMSQQLVVMSKMMNLVHKNNL
ncbi:MAG: hypothetical protein H8D92_02165 [Pelagibacteraceae bacterium]|nr:hypothetical protein [Pelagibacteraceae bacterium]